MSGCPRRPSQIDPLLAAKVTALATRFSCEVETLAAAAELADCQAVRRLAVVVAMEPFTDDTGKRLLFRLR